MSQSAANPVCILDDDVSILRAIVRLLASDGLAGRTFENVGDFLAHARKHEIEVAVIDVCLGDANGMEVHRRLREISPVTRVIMMTAQDEPGLRSAALRNGASALLLKPFEDRAFLAHVRGALAIGN